MNLLIIGAGAVGSAYGYFASQAGAKVSYLVKPKHRSSVESGLTLYHWKGRKAETIEFKDFQIYDSNEALRGKNFDAVLITVPSDKLKVGDWFEKLLPVIGKARVWALQSNSGDIEWLASQMGSDGYDRLVWGRIPIMSYLAPMPGEPFEKPGYAFYIPPGGKAIWTAKKPELTQEAVSLFSKGGLPSKADAKDFRSSGLLEESVLRMIVAGMERSEWSLDRLMNGENIYLVQEGIRETTAILAKRYKVSDPMRKISSKFVSSPFGLRTVAKVAKRLFPFDLEAFLRVHFTKVDTQMHEAIDDLIDSGKRNGMSTTNLILLRGRKRTTA